MISAVRMNLYRIFNKAELVGKSKSGIELYKSVRKDGTEVLRSFKDGIPVKTIEIMTESHRDWNKMLTTKRRYSIYNHKTSTTNNIDARSYSDSNAVTEFGFGGIHQLIPPGKSVRIVLGDLGKYAKIFAGECKDGKIHVFQERKTGKYIHMLNGKKFAETDMQGHKIYNA